MQSIRWGILATGLIAGKFVEDLRLLPDAEVVAVGSRTPQAAQAFAERYAIPRAYGSWQALADDPGVDAVYVATPHPAHYAASLLCLRAGKATLTEKPFTLHVPDAQELVATARSRGVFLMEAMWMRCLPGIARVRELVADGNTGMLFGYASGALAALTCSLLGDTARRATITGTAGRIELPRNFYRPTELVLHQGEDRAERIETPFPGLGYHFEAAEVHRCLRAGLVESPLVPHDDTLSVMRTLDAVRQLIGVN